MIHGNFYPSETQLLMVICLFSCLILHALLELSFSMLKYYGTMNHVNLLSLDTDDIKPSKCQGSFS